MRRGICALIWMLTPAFLSFTVPARAQADPATLPAHDTHQMLLIAAKPYTMAGESKEKFGKHTPYEGGILAIDVYFRNDNDAPIRINLQTVQLRIGEPHGQRQKLDPLSAEDVANRTLLKGDKDPTAPRLPHPLPGELPKTGRGKDWDEFDSALRSAAMSSDVLPPHATTHGFFYFDVARHFDWLPDATLDVSDLAFMTTKQALFFFEIDLAPAIK
jgi:hypothetical protein